MSFTSRLAVVALASLFFAGTALAQTTAPASSDAKTTKTTTEKKPRKERSAESLECSKQADAKGLHGKERQKFRSECKKEARSGAEKK